MEDRDLGGLMMVLAGLGGGVIGFFAWGGPAGFLAGGVIGVVIVGVIVALGEAFSGG